ncbi:MAG: DUF4089 domain-containing protein [Acetobacteraceae bacterium]|nr:DUF4089 domain-containing protein [Acetobacteraceae bacterium]
MTQDELDQWIRLGALALGIPVRPEWIETIRTHLEISLGHASRLDEIALADDAEPAPVFHA